MTKPRHQLPRERELQIETDGLSLRLEHHASSCWDDAPRIEADIAILGTYHDLLAGGLLTARGIRHVERRLKHFSAHVEEAYFEEE